jgi:hypothetical protein
MSLNVFRLPEMTHMSQQLYQTWLVWPSLTVLVVGLTAWFVWLSLSINRLPPEAQRNEKAAEVNKVREAGPPRPQVSGESARVHLEQTTDDQSLIPAVNAARFGLKWQALAPLGGETGAGYVGMSHDQNLNAWFSEHGVTVRPTVSEQQRERSRHMDMRLKAYGYGDRLADAPPIVSQRVMGNRIEYERAENFEVRLSHFGLQDESIFNRQAEIRNPKIAEWYDNRAEGIEQGFTIDVRPKREADAGKYESLRLVLSLNGDLRAEVTDDAQAIELTDATGKRTLSYSKLTALDADGKHLPSHMETSADCIEIALVVDDRSASYPIVIDRIVASLEPILEEQ